MFQVPNSKFVFSDPDLSPKPLQIDESKIEQIVNTSGKHEYVHEQDKSVFVHFYVDGAILCGVLNGTVLIKSRSVQYSIQGLIRSSQGHDPFIFERFFQKINQI